MRTCKHCSKDFDLPSRSFSNHVRWCSENPKRNKNNCSEGVRKRNIVLAEQRHGKLRSYSVKCNICSKKFCVEMREKKFEQKDKFFCSRSCANTRSHSIETKAKIGRSTSITTKRLWNDSEYVRKQMSRNPRFTSKGEVIVRSHFINKFPDDEWTFGGSIIRDGHRVVRDLYSKKLKINIEYDGIWHFKDIKGQLESKQLKDKSLAKWSRDKGWRLIRISESKFYEDPEAALELLEQATYESNNSLTLLGEEYGDRDEIQRHSRRSSN